jgi:hypothetical protein
MSTLTTRMNRLAALGLCAWLVFAASSVDAASRTVRTKRTSKTAKTSKPRKTKPPSVSVLTNPVDTIVAQPGPTSLPVTIASTTAAPTTVAVKPISAPIITGVDVLANDTIMHLQAPENLQWSARIRISAVGMVQFAREFVGRPGQIDFSLDRALDPDSQYTVRVAWDAVGKPLTEVQSQLQASLPAFPGPSATLGTSTVKVIPPKYPQPLTRSAGPVAGPGWTSLLTTDQKTTRRNPCAEWRIVYDDRNAPLDFQDRLKDVVAQTAAATGVNIVYAGISQGPPTDPRELRVAWDPATTATLGLATQSYVADAGGTIWRTNGRISMAGRRRGITADRWSGVFLHEMGHLFGLDHTTEPTSPMYSPVESGANWPYAALLWTTPDLAGLKAMNIQTGGCTTVLTDPNAAVAG